MSSNSTFNTLPTLDATNWKHWSTQMTAYLMHSGVWDAVTTAEPSPRTYAEATATAAASTNREEIRDWKDKNMKALGSIRLRLSTSVASKVEDKTTAKETWDKLKEPYDNPTVASILHDFKSAMNIQVPANAHPV